MYHWYYFENIRRGSYQFPIEFYHVTEEHPRYIMPYHWHPELEIIVVHQGKLTTSVDNKRYELQSADILYIPPNAVHGAIPYDCVYECVVCDLMAFLQNNTFFSSYVGLFFGDKKIRSCYSREDTDIAQTITRLFQTMKNRSDGWQILTIGCLLQFLGIVSEHNYFESENESKNKTMKNCANINRFQNVFKLIRNNYAREITLEDMAAQVHMSPNYFCQVFKEITHYSPIEYLMNYRIECSKYLLCMKNSSVSEAAFLSGFNSCAYYIKVFKEITGLTPNKYKKEHMINV